MSLDLRRQCEIEGIEEVSNLEPGMDFRKPQYRREVWLRFYEFHLTYKIHPGLVYLFFPYLAEKYGWNQEQKLWFAFINGCTQNPCTTMAVFEEFPDLHSLKIDEMEKWHRENWRKLDYDTDSRYRKGHLVEMTQDYLKHLAGRTQDEFFNEFLGDQDPRKQFEKSWNYIYNNFFMYGRVSTFSYLEFLAIMGLPVEFTTFFMYDLTGSKSHRNGILKVCGRDDLEWYKGDNGVLTHTPDIMAFADREAMILFREAKERFKGKEFYNSVVIQTMESTLCCYKGWYRKNRRYPNVYTDMSFDRIKKAEKLWEGKKSFDVFWEAREKCLPKELLLEKNPNDPGKVPYKMNWYRETGEVIMMDHFDPVFTNHWNKNSNQKYVQSSLF